MDHLIFPFSFVEEKILSNHKVNIFLYSPQNKMPKVYKNSEGYYEKLKNHEKQYIENFWQKYSNQNPQAFNGNLAKINWLDIKSNVISASSVDYKAFLATSSFEFYKNNIQLIANPLTVTPIVVTKDHKLVIGYRKNTKILQFPGGMLDYIKDSAGNELSIIKCAEREILEELCSLDTFDYKYLGMSISLKDIFTTIYVYCRTSSTYQEIFNRRTVSKNNIADFWEMPEIFSVNLTATALSEILSQKCTGTMYAGLMLLGRRLFGKKWYSEHICSQRGEINLDFNC